VRALLITAACALCACPSSSPLLLDHVVPGVGSARGGEEITLVGTGFAPETVVRMGGQVVSSEWFDGETMMVFTPPGIQGPVDISVTRVDGAESIAAAAYQYVAFDPWFVDGLLTALPVGGSSLYTSLGAGDFDGDLDPDVVVAGPQIGIVRWENQDLGQFRVAETVPGAVSHVGVADFDGDGLADVFGCGTDAGFDRLWMGDPAGWVEAERGSLPAVADTCAEVVVADVDADGQPDLVLLALDEPASYVRVLLNRSAAGAPRFVVHDGMESPASLDGLVFGETLAEDGASDVTLEASVGLGFGAAAGRLQGVFGGVGGAAGVRFARQLFVEPSGVSVQVLGGGDGAQLVVRLVDGNGEQFVWGLGSLDGGASALESGALSAASADGDGVFDPPVEAVDVLLVSSEAGLVDLAFDSVVLETSTGPVRIEDFERREFVLASEAGAGSLALGDVNADGTPDMVLGGESGVRAAAQGGNDSSDGVPGWSPSPPVQGPVIAVAVLPSETGADVLAQGSDAPRRLQWTGAGLEEVPGGVPGLAAGGPMGLVVGDLDRDGLPDALLLRDGQDDLLHRAADGDQIWSARLPLADAPSIDAAMLDVDRDGDDDLLFLGEGPTHRLVLSVDEDDAR